MTDQRKKVTAIVAVDESTSGKFVTSGAAYIPLHKIDFVKAALARVKTIYEIDADAETHCRILFAPDARRKSKFRHMPPDKTGQFLLRIVQEVSLAGCQWFGVSCDSEQYPKKLNLNVSGPPKPFDVTAKHIAGLLMAAGNMAIEQQRGPDFSLIFDKDSTKLDWGLARRMQATHFARISEKAIELDEQNAPFLELADIAAYTFGRALSAREEINNRKLQKFATIHRAMNMVVTTFSFPKDLRNPALLTP